MWWLVIAALIATPRPPRGQRPAPADQAPSPQEQVAPEEVPARIRAYLGSIDTPIGAAQWRALGPGAADPLEKIIQNPDELPTRRAHALDGLVAVAPDRAAVLVGKLARDEREPTVVRVAALHRAPHVRGGRPACRRAGAAGRPRRTHSCHARPHATGARQLFVCPLMRSVSSLAPFARAITAMAMGRGKVMRTTMWATVPRAVWFESAR